ncbi:conserved hypothetical protein [Methanococcus aeolicus Nankai-3]|uniref:Nucleic acid binding OB-fold tRNA/helicase-type n=1 Tax=Methanococcus aeolicus (strain ATCC BAA-1280 / DSM 17508 / OCM 812 / Nankai-3) TaxID=419665 RepID=A6UUJ3_META3|nr:hypothetical protein [Methanococcus aeolicus]ABR56165.1 conserved hypothetical protein [Methanococcus aeolicus Nankai-3]
MHMVKKFNIDNVIKHAKTMPSAALSLIIWSAITIWATIISKDIWVLLCALPFIIALTIIPLIISKMNNNISQELIPEYEKKLSTTKIGDINKEMLNQQVKVVGTVEKITYGISPKPTIRIKDETGKILSLLIVPLPEGVKKGDKIALYGVISKHYKYFGFMGVPKLWKPKIFGIGVNKL